LLVVAFVIGLGKDPTKLPSPFIGKPAPSFELPALRDESKTVSNADFNGKVVLVNFWATWCVGCRQEHEFLRKLTTNNVIPIYGINWRDNRREAINWLDTLGDPYIESAFDGENHTGIDWGVYGAPETFLIGADGIVLYKFLGPLSEAAWQRELVPLIRAANGGSTP